MISKQELLKKQKNLNIPLTTVEKDYVLGLILSSFYSHPVLKEDWVFKGGTCLKKLYIPEYRFSEDLDFTIKQQGTTDSNTIKKYLLEAFSKGRELFGLGIESENIKIDPFLDKDGLFIQVKIPYQSPLMPSGSLPVVKLDLSKEETIEDNTVWRSLVHDYSDESIVSIPIQSYSLDEIFAEKCRALVQRTRPRDLYDVINIYEKFYVQSNNFQNFNRVIQRKFHAKNLEFPEPLSQITQEKFEETRHSWSYMLRHQVQHLEDIQIYIEKYRKVCAWIERIQ
jgi:predicted nucleotidyltransferase component of viral defense system